MRIVSTSTFRQSLHGLCRKPKHKYTSCPCDICNELDQKAVESLVITNNAVYNDDGVKFVIKIRLACAAQNKGKSGGFRLIAVGNRKSQELVLLDIFPKTGTQAKSNISESDLGILLKTYIKERNNDQLVVHDLKKELAEIPKEETSAQ